MSSIFRFFCSLTVQVKHQSDNITLRDELGRKRSALFKVFIIFACHLPKIYNLSCHLPKMSVRAYGCILRLVDVCQKMNGKLTQVCYQFCYLDQLVNGLIVEQHS